MATGTETEGRYGVADVERRWRKAWAEHPPHEARDGVAPKFYCLEQFPYPSGHLHMGHVRVYTIGDVLARYFRMRGWNVLHPMGWDAFGMPAENAAIKAGGHPETYTRANIAHMKGQMEELGLALDWPREVATCDPEYYRFTQELFLLLYERGLAYQRSGAVNWCPSCETVLANEQVEEGRCWRCDTVVVKKDLVQWYFRITAYADRLLEGLTGLDWPGFIKSQQQHWIGRSEGAEVVFPVDGREPIRVFTTRPDTLFGATYVVLAPEHPLVAALVEGRPQEAAVQAFVMEQRNRPEIQRVAEGTEKLGLFTGSYARHPLTGAPVPIWVGNYVLSEYGTGAVMGVPAHDPRDYEFARRYGLPVVTVVVPPSGEAPADAAYTAPGRLVASGEFDGLASPEAQGAIAAALAARGLGGPHITYRMRDWLISRQRYWGAPIPIIHCPRCGAVPVPKEDLPVRLPQDVTFTGEGASPLAAAHSWLEVSCPRCGGQARRETDTMDTFVDSSWYYLRYISPHDTEAPFDRELARFWMPVDLYVGGKEHAILHQLYSRFITKVLFDAGWVAVEEPFHRLVVQGMVVNQGAKMSKSKGNTVSPEDMVRLYGADAVRLFMLFQAPYDKDMEWSEAGVEGTARFLQRVWRVVAGRGSGGGGDADERVLREVARVTRKVTQDIGERQAFNTAVAALMELTNVLSVEQAAASEAAFRKAQGALTQMLAPFAPFVAEELWHRLGERGSVHQSRWPDYDAERLADQEVEIAIQINGRVRARMTVAAGLDEEALAWAALNHPPVAALVGDRTVARVIAVPGRLVNVVVA
jgi:leucyl-tRNA synthetase